MDGLKLHGDASSIVVTVTDTNGNPVNKILKIKANSDGTYSLTDANGDTNVSLDALGANQSYNISYTIPTFSDIMEHKQFNPNNKAEGKVDLGNDITITSKGEDTRDIWINAKPIKSGIYDKGNGQIKWEITVNAGHSDIAGKVLTDDMFKNAVGNITVDPNDGNCQVIEENGVKKIEFKGKPTNYKKYVITYYTKALEQTDQTQTVTNKASFDDQDFHTDVVIPAEGGGGSGGEDKPADKPTKECLGAEVNADGTREVKWKCTYPAGNLTSITDLVRYPDQYGLDKTRHYLTYDQAKKVNETLKEQLKADGILETDYEIKFSPYGTWDWRTFDQFSSNDQFVGFQISATDNNKPIKFTTPLSFEYTSTVVPKKDGDKFVNSFGDANATYTYDEGNVFKTDADGKTGTVPEVSKDGIITWKVKVKLGEKLAGKTDLTVDITDHLPAGVTLQSLNCGFNFWSETEANSEDVNIGQDGTLSWKNTGIVSDRVNISGQYTHNENEKDELKICLTQKDPNAFSYRNDEFVMLTYTCRIDDWDSMKYHDIKTFENSVHVDIGNKPHGDSTMTQEVTKVVDTMDKTHSWDNNSEDNKLSYTVTINPEGKDLLTTSDTLELEDIISSTNSNVAQTGEQVTLDTSSLKLYTYDLIDGLPDKNTDGSLHLKEVTDWNWSYENKWNEAGGWQNVLTATVPDGKPLVLKYDYTVLFVKGDVAVSNPDLTLRLNNSVTLKGNETITDSDQTTDQEKQSQTITKLEGANEYQLIKYKQGDINQKLNDAEFTVYDKDKNVIKVYKTDGYDNNKDKGKIVIQWEDNGPFEKNKLYYLVETDARTGYKLPDDPPKYYFYWSEGENWNIEGLDALPQGAHVTNLTINSAIINVPNEANDANDAYTLPATGGAGVLPIRLLGGGLLSAALALALLRRKHS